MGKEARAEEAIEEVENKKAKVDDVAATEEDGGDISSEGEDESEAVLNEVRCPPAPAMSL